MERQLQPQQKKRRNRNRIRRNLWPQKRQAQLAGHSYLLVHVHVEIAFASKLLEQRELLIVAEAAETLRSGNELLGRVAGHLDDASLDGSGVYHCLFERDFFNYTCIFKRSHLIGHFFTGLVKVVF